MPSVAHAAGAAKRRRERRLRQFLRHERLTVAMLLAETQHHAAPRGQNKATSGGKARDVLHGQVPGAPLPQGSRPPCLGEPRGPQERIQQRTMEQLADVVPMVQILDIPVPQMVEQLPDVLRFFDTLQPVPEQAIEVPKILLDDVPVRTPVRDTQLLEQLVEVPTILSYSSLQRTTEQHVDIPVPRRGGRNAGLQGFLPGQSSKASQLSLERISERLRSRSFLVEDFLPGQGSPSSSHVPPRDQEGLDEPGEGFFSNFLKKCEVGSALESEGARQCQLIHAGGSARGCARAGLQRVGAVP